MPRTEFDFDVIGGPAVPPPRTPAPAKPPAPGSAPAGQGGGK